MRIGFNPNKDKIQEPHDFFHQVIVPVYIPIQEGYFKDSFIILQYCLQSLFKTSHQKTHFTIINNGSCTEVADYLNSLYQENKIQELIHTTNIGKLNAILKGITGQNFDIVTITDADVLFLNGWQNASYAVFESFPLAGAVSPTPSSKVLKHHTNNVLASNFFSSSLKFTKTINKQALLDFAISIGNEQFYNEYHLDYNLTLESKSIRAVIGAGHFVASYRGVVFENLPQKHSVFNLGGDSESKILDEPVMKYGYWRLSTEDNYAYHMGNVLENWMLEKLENIKGNDFEVEFSPILKSKKQSLFSNWIRKFFFDKFIYRKPFWKWFVQYKGLSKEAADVY